LASNIAKKRDISDLSFAHRLDTKRTVQTDRNLPARNILVKRLAMHIAHQPWEPECTHDRRTDGRSPIYCCYTTLWNAEVVVWTFTTTMNSCWVPHAGSENHCETRKSLKICYVFNINQEQVYRTKILDVDQLNNDASVTSGPRFESHGYWMWWSQVASASTHLRSCWRWTFWGHTVIKMMWC